MISAIESSLENVGEEMVSPVIAPRRRVIVVPVAIVDRNSHLRRIAIIKAVRAAVVAVSPVVVRIRNVRIVIKFVVVDGGILISPAGTIRSLLSICCISLVHDRKRNCAETGNKKATKHA